MQFSVCQCYGDVVQLMCMPVYALLGVVCIVTGTALGSGVYFAVDANYSMGYSSGRQMFQVRVLVGETVLGNSSLRTAPVKSGTNRPYDSVTNSTNSPSMYVIFHDAQAYPEYLISF